MTRYTAIVKIIRVDEARPASSSDRSPKIDKHDVELAAFTVRNSDLDQLKAKLAAHIDLIEE